MFLHINIKCEFIHTFVYINIYDGMEGTCELFEKCECFLLNLKLVENIIFTVLQREVKDYVNLFLRVPKTEWLPSQ